MNLSSFERLTTGATTYYRCRAFAGLPGVRHGFSTRAALDHATFIADVGLDPTRLVPLSQFHSDRFHIIMESASPAEPPLRGDALVSTGRPIAVRVSDCFPILIADPDRRCVAAVHAGWRGTLSRVLAKTICGMSDTLGSKPSRLLIAIGPAIRSCCFEVGPEVADAFAREYPHIPMGRPHPERPDKTLLDLRAALEVQLDALGVSRSNVFDLEACTACRTDVFFSYRKERDQAGRMMAVIGVADA
jgi:purine-nucleoside/S-methyl-5'-thioadenosine phosphorylase / adenosine deaminase